jgi:hypothetical protein
MESGIILKTEFIEPGGALSYEEFIDYEDDDLKTAWFPQAEDSLPYEGIIDYQDDDRKVTWTPAEKARGKNKAGRGDGLFTRDKDQLDEDAKEQLKEIYRHAQKNGSLEWLMLFSFDEEFLREHNLITEEGLHEERIKDCTRKAVSTLLKKEDLSDAVWSASIHQNLKVHNNYHVHISAVEPTPSWTAGAGRCRTKSDGSLYQRGKLKNTSIKAAKSSFISALAKSTAHDDMTTRIGRIRDRLYSIRKESVHSERRSKEFLSIIAQLPEDMRLWKYGMNAMSPYRDRIDKFTTTFLHENCASEYSEYTRLIMEKQEQYKRIYGDSDADYAENKLHDLYNRLGNVLLREMADYEKERRASRQKQAMQYNAEPQNPRADIFRELVGASVEIEKAAYSMKRLNSAFRKTIEGMKNQMAYERLRDKEEGLTR